MTTYRLVVFNTFMDRKTHIINTYLELGSKNGFASVSLNNIAEEEGINKASIFSHFKSYSELKEQADAYCLNVLQSKEISVDFTASSVQEVLENLINGFIDTFSDSVLSKWLTCLEQLKSTSPKHKNYSRAIDSMISARITVALDYCVQRGWSDINDTDAVSALITPFVRSMLISEEKEDTLEDVLSAFVKLIFHLG